MESMDTQLPKHARTPASSLLYKRDKRALHFTVIPSFPQEVPELIEQYETNRQYFVQYQDQKPAPNSYGLKYDIELRCNISEV